MTPGSPRRLPMFPVGSVLFPHQLLPLHVFEPRYRVLTQRCLEGDRRFGVVLIERGHEVGGGDVRGHLGTVAEIIRAGRFPDGRWLLETVGRERIRVERWLPDDPHPWAEVVELRDEPTRVSDEELGHRRNRVAARLRRLLGLRAELGEPAPPPTAELDDDPVTAAWQVAALASLTPLDCRAVLAVDEPGERLRLLDELLEAATELAEARLS